MTRAAEGDDARFSRWVLVVAGLAVLGWAVPALVMLDKGFSVQDEGTYVLAYRWWSSNPYFVPGAQYVYGPLFEALHESIPLLRLSRLVMALGFNLGFGYVFAVWLERRPGGRPPGSRTSLVLLVTAAGGMSYLWSPLTPGYYDLTADVSLALVALMLVLFLPSGRHTVVVASLATGALVAVLMVVKWTAVGVLGVIIGAEVWVLARRGERPRARAHLALVGLGAAGALVGCQVFLTPVARLLSASREVSAFTAVGSHSLGYLIHANLASTATTLLGAAVMVLPLVVGHVVAWRLARAGRPAAARRCVAVAAVLNAFFLPFALGWRGGDGRGRVVIAIAFGGLLVAFGAGLIARRGAPSMSEERAVVLVLLTVPLLQAAGTNVPLLYVAGECLAMWVALALLLVSTARTDPLPRFAVVVDLLVVVGATAMICGSTTLLSPYKTSGLRQDSVMVPQLGVRVGLSAADQYRALTRALAPYVTRDRTPVFSLDEKAGLTYLLGGVPVGSTWTDAASPTRTAGILRVACRDEPVVTDRRPVLIFDRHVDPAVAGAMRSCGFGYPQAYRRLIVRRGPPGVRVFVPQP